MYCLAELVKWDATISVSTILSAVGVVGSIFWAAVKMTGIMNQAKADVDGIKTDIDKDIKPTLSKITELQQTQIKMMADADNTRKTITDLQERVLFLERSARQ